MTIIILKILTEEIMSSKKKNKIAKLTDEQYSEYIMSLKDEKPPKPVRNLQEK